MEIENCLNCHKRTLWLASNSKIQDDFIVFAPAKVFDIKSILVIAYIFRGFYCNSLCSSVFGSFWISFSLLLLNSYNKLLLLHRCLNVNTYCKDTLNLIFIRLLSIEKKNVDTFFYFIFYAKKYFFFLIKLFAFFTLVCTIGFKFFFSLKLNVFHAFFSFELKYFFFYSIARMHSTY